ncbi:hypothetical protein ES705_04832 [subsurface metagenome]
MSDYHAWLWIKKMISCLEQLLSFRGKVDVITGTSRGIITALDRGFSLAGTHVIGFGRPMTPEWNGNQISVDLDIVITDEE